MGFGKTSEPVDQPFGGKIRRGADREYARALALQQPFGTDRDSIEGVADHGEVVTTGLGDHQPLPFPVEQLDPELRFQRFDLVRDGALSDA
jgi:hypothetical protein